jgi:hypothetical protein
MKGRGLEIRAMRRGWKVWGLAMVAAFAYASNTAAQASPYKRSVHERQATHYRSYLRSMDPAYARRLHGRRGTGFVALVGDPDSGLGFYPLPMHYRLGAWRYRLTHQRPPWQNPVLFAIAADAARYNYWIPGNRDYVNGVFNPYDGVGTPFFGGYYGPAGDDDEPSPFPFGRPYTR